MRKITARRYDISKILTKSEKKRYKLAVKRRVRNNNPKHPQLSFVDKLFTEQFRFKFKNKYIFPKLLELVKWLIIDFYRFIRYGKKIEFSNFYMIVGRRGAGKSQTLTYLLYNLRKQYGDKIIIATNYYFKGQDFPLEHWKQILEDYNKPIIFGFDEIQQEFDSRDWTNFPANLFNEISQSRKKSKMIMSTAQFYEMVDIKIRKYSDYVIDAYPVMGIKRWIRFKTYDRIDYEKKLANANGLFDLKMRAVSNKSYIAGDYFREMYDSFKVIERTREKKYIPMKETTYTPVEKLTQVAKIK